jgi:CrcB protein
VTGSGPPAALGAFLLVGFGGAAGALARHLVGRVVAGRRATLAVNVLGSVALGAVVSTGAATDGSVALALGTGFCGAFTTFSSFAVGVVELAADGREGVAVRFAAVNLVGALMGVGVGSMLAGLSP